MTGGALVSALVLAGGPAEADSAPQAPETVSTVTADTLPTMQVNGVVWDQVVVGTTVYAVGEFTASRPAGAAVGTSETAVSNAVAYDLTTGVQKLGWIPKLNGAAQTVTASPDGSAIYIGGDFTSVTASNGTFARSRLVSVNPATGAVNAGFTANANQRVAALTFSGNTLYAGGAFTSVNSTARQRLAAVSPTTGALTAWAPTADQDVLAIAVPQGTGSVIVAGRIGLLNGVQARGSGAVDLATGKSTLPWAMNKKLQNYGTDSAFYSLKTKGSLVFGSAYDYDGPSDFESTFAANASDGSLVWVSGCRGDSYDVAPIGDVLYNVSHAHNCSSIGGHPQSDPATYQRVQAVTIAADGVNDGGAFSGWARPRLLAWTPTVAAGSFTGQGQAAWTIEGNADYVAIGGEFPSVNNLAQQGLARFTVASKAPNAEGPQGVTALKPTLVSLVPGAVRVSWQAAWDRDNRQLTYEVLRGANVSTAQVVAKATADSSWWDRPLMLARDTTAAAGSTVIYRVRTTDAFGNALVSSTTEYTVPTVAASTSAYRDAVLSDGATKYWRLGETSGTTAYDWVGSDDLTLATGVTRGVQGGVGDSDLASGFPGSAGVPGVSRAVQKAPDTMSIEAWVKTTSTSGGKIVGFGDSATRTSPNSDRHLYMSNDGRITFGVYTDTFNTLTSRARLNDGQWHQAVATMGADGMALYIDGKLVARNASVTGGQAYSGYWRVGGDAVDGWPNAGSSGQLTGAIDDVSIYRTALTADQVGGHYTKSGRTLTESVPAPTDAYGKAVNTLKPTLYWRLDERSGATAAADSSLNGADGVVSSTGVTFGQTGALASQGTGARFNDGVVVASTPETNPTTYSASVWFKTTSTTGGRLIGFGDSGNPNQLSGSYDRHLYMTGDGRLHFGTYSTQANLINTGMTYNDGQWHNVVATQSAAGMVLYVDGVKVGTNAAAGAQAYTGYWRIGGDSSWDGDPYFDGQLDEAAVFDRALTAGEVTSLRATAGYNTAPTAAFTSTSKALAVSVDASTSGDADGTIAKYAWDFGDGQAATGKSATHTYAKAGTYTVTLTVTDNRGATGVLEQKVTVAVSLKAVSATVSRAGYGNVLYVNVNPNRGSASYQFQVQQLGTDNAWTTLKTVYKTAGNGETRSITLSKGTYRVSVLAGGGYAAAVSKSVELTDPTVAVKLKTDAKRSKFKVDVNPNKGSGYYTFQVQQQVGSTWTTLKTTYKTSGSSETRTLNLAKGTYRVVVPGKYGYLGATSASVTLLK